MDGSIIPEEMREQILDGDADALWGVIEAVAQSGEVVRLDWCESGDPGASPGEWICRIGAVAVSSATALNAVNVALLQWMELYEGSE